MSDSIYQVSNISPTMCDDIYQIIRTIIGKKAKIPFSARTEEFQDLLQTIELSLVQTYTTEYNSADVAEYILEKYITSRSTKRIRGDLGLDLLEAETKSEIKDEVPLKIQQLLAIPQPEQKSQAWLNQRQSFITASVFGEACGLKGPVAMVSLLLDKISYGKYAPFGGNRATQWGEKYEDIANAIYAFRNKCKVYEFGMIAHPQHYFLGASTDGISSELINIEIKCPFSRIITGVTPKAYWAQTQLQMNVLDLDRTHFIECKITEYPSFKGFFQDFNWSEEEGEPMQGNQITFKDPPKPGHHLEKGLLFEVIDHNQTNLRGHPKTIYMHSPIHLYRDKEGLLSWYRTTLKEILSSPNLIYVRTIPWLLSRVSCVEILRDATWFEKQIPKVTEFWKDVEYYREKNLSLIEIGALKEMFVQKYAKMLGTSPRSSPKSSPPKAPMGLCLDPDDEALPTNVGCMLDDDDMSEKTTSSSTSYKSDNKPIKVQTTILPLLKKTQICML